LLKETGRLSISPVFVVGVYSGADKLGEGFGSSLKMAEFRAAEDALLRLYLTRTPTHQLSLPSANIRPGAFELESSDGLSSSLEVDASYTPPELGEQETVYASAGRSSIVLGNGEKRGKGREIYVDDAEEP
jgi:large subunit ribosomal protein L44